MTEPGRCRQPPITIRSARAAALLRRLATEGRSQVDIIEEAHERMAAQRKTLSPAQKRFLAARPMIAREGDVCYVHASAASPQRWTYIDGPTAARRCVDAAGATYTFCGHVHDQLLYFESAQGKMREFRPSVGVPIPARGPRRWVGIVGSVGQPRDRNPAAAYTLFDPARSEVTFCRVVYDARAAADRIRACGLPGSLAYRVELGI